MYSFVVVWDKPGSGRITDIPSDLAPPFYTFAGEILNGKSSNTLNAEHTKARGNAFACIAQSPDMVREQMKKSVYYQKVKFFPDVIYKDAFPLMYHGATGNLGYGYGSDLCTRDGPYRELDC
ncbi:hypothetical protein N7445_005207 [Penicillium cf. griseofulvum]|nr:hypothetical protein N7445_005207 [Penicillium cf. griseofulvum]